MRKNLLLSFAFLSMTVPSIAQDNSSTKDDKQLVSVQPDSVAVGDTYNKWTIEVDAGMSKGLKPYNDNNKYFGSNPDKFLGGFQFNHFGVAARYMFSPKFGIKSHVSFDDVRNLKGSESLPFSMHCYQITFEGVVNATRVFDIGGDNNKFGLLFHFGLQGGQMSPKLSSDPKTEGRHEYNGGLVLGLTPEYLLFKKLSVFIDVSTNAYIRQHFNWDGSHADRSNNLTGHMFSTSIGLAYSLGKGEKHGDWAIIKDKNQKELDSINNRIGEIETMLNDSDKDGVPDYLDVENNSIAGVAVDSKGRMVDKNNNGVADDLEKYVEKSISDNNQSAAAAKTGNSLEQLVNEGYIAVFFDSNKAQPNNSSVANIGFILNYLKNNPDKSIEITGYSDEVGPTERNIQLGNERAQNVKNILVKSGIDASRLTVKSFGEDASVDKNSDQAKKLVRKTVFKIK